MVWTGCPVCRGLADQFGVDQVISLPWTECPVWSGKRRWKWVLGILSISMKLKASTIRSELNKNIQENERLRLANKEIKALQRKINSKRARDRKSLEIEVLKLALEGEFQMVAQFGEMNWRDEDEDATQSDDQAEELIHHYGIGVFSELSEYGFETVPMTPEPLPRIQYFIQSADKTTLLETEKKLIYFWDEFVEICERDKIARLLTLLTNHKTSPETSVNVKSLVLLLDTVSSLIDRYYDTEPDSDVLCLLDDFEECLTQLDIDDPTSHADYDQYLLSWKKTWKSEIENDELLNGRYCNWIANKDGQRFFNLTEWAIAECVKDLSSQLTLGLTVEKSKTTVALVTPDIAENYDGNLTPPQNGILCPASPLSPQHLVRIFKHLGFKVNLANTGGDNTESYSLVLQW